MAAPSRVSSAFLYLLLCLCAAGHALEDRGGGFPFAGVEVLWPAAVCSAPAAGLGRNQLMVVHSRGACSPAAAADAATAGGLQSLAGDSRRVSYLNGRIGRSSPPPGKDDAAALRQSRVSLPAQSGDVVGSGNYVVTVGFGTPAADQTVIFDTGSDVCWIQCKPCADTCYKQDESIFDPAASETYRNVSCDADACANLAAAGCSGGACVYAVRYGDNSSTVGFLATEKLTLSPVVVFQSFVFGCGQSNRGLFAGAAGLLGLARSPYSLVSQASRRLGNAFSYCLPGPSATGHLTVGGSAARPAAPAAYTTMLSDAAAPSLYFIDLTGISVGGQKLPVEPAVFRSAGTIIDSGTVITRLPPPAYRALSSAFRTAMSPYPPAEPVSILDTCFDLGGVRGRLSSPPITLHFDGADVALQLQGILIPINESVACLAFAGNDDPAEVGIIGNIQQQGIEVIYDIAAQKIGFAPGACS